MIRAFKTELDPNNVQKTVLLRHAGVARFTYNWGLSRRIEEYGKTGKSSNAIEQHRQLTGLKKTDFPWMYGVSKCAPQEALRDLDRAFNNFWARCKKGAFKKGFPRFKSKHRGNYSFRLTESIHIENSRIKLPRIGWIRLKEKGYIPSDQKILSATVSRCSGRWFVSVHVDTMTDPPKTKVGVAMGVDVGVKNLAVCSDGKVFESPLATKHHEVRLRRLSKQFSRRARGSRNRAKTKLRLSRLYRRIACVRGDSIHRATTDIIRVASVIGIESLNVAGMMKNRKLSKSIQDASMSEFLRQLKYKAEWNGVRVVEADRFYPSSKRCSGCGYVKTELSLSEREYVCGECGLTLDRDLNAALNLKSLAVSSTVTACGVSSSGTRNGVKLGIVKQEPDSECVFGTLG